MKPLILIIAIITVFVNSDVLGQCSPVIHYDTHVSCGPFTWPNNGKTYNYSNHVAVDTIHNGAANGCDSIVILDLEVSPSYEITQVVQSCYPYTWIDGNTYSSPNSTASVSYTSIHGCDSTVHLNLYMENAFSDTTFLDTTICENETLSYNGKSYTTSGQYHDTINTNIDTIPKSLVYGNNIPVHHVSNANYGWGKPTLYFDYNSDGAAIQHSNGDFSLMKLDEPFWRGNGNIQNSIVNQIGVWTNNIPFNQWYGSTFIIDVPVTKTYYIMLVGDNSFRFSLNDVVQITSDPNEIIIAEGHGGSGPTSVTFTWLHIYPIQLTAGCHTITLEGNNFDGVGMFGGAILDNTDTEIINATQNSELNYIFTTETVSDFYDSSPVGSCPAGTIPLGPNLCDDCISSECDDILQIDLEIIETKEETYIDTICKGETVDLFNNTYDETGVFIDTLRSISGCDSVYYKLDLTVLNLTVDAGKDSSICEGDFIILTADVDESLEYSWNNGVEDGIAFSPDSTTSYELTGVLNGCTATDEMTVYVEKNPEVSFTANPLNGIPPLEVNFENTSNNPAGIDYTWDFADGTIIQDNNIFVNHTYINPGNFEVKLTGENWIGCEDFAKLLIEIKTPKLTFEFPNVFTPNGDYVNDKFKLINHEYISSIDILIVNRWGNLVFESQNVNFEWNGQIKNTGRECVDGVYFYIAKINGQYGEYIEEHGFIHLIRKD